MSESKNSDMGKISPEKLIPDYENTLPMVTVLVPCRNEKKFIGPCLDSILKNDYPENLFEIIVLDGKSQDGSKEVIEEFSRRFNQIRVFENEKQITPTALNLGISNARGEIIIWMSSHNRYDSKYISLSVKSLLESGADNVGGIMVTLPRVKTLMGRGIAACLSHSFGVGNSLFRVHPDKPVWVDTVFGGCYRRGVFEKIGLFNEELVRGQDMEFNLRLKKAGGRTLLVPDILTYYYARSDMKSFLMHNWINGVWAVLPFAYSVVMPVSWRHLVPLAFVIGLFGSAILGIISTPFFWLCAVVITSYGLLNIAASFQIAKRERDLRFFFIMPLIFGALHFGYGLGSLWGVVRLTGTPQFWNRLFGIGGLKCNKQKIEKN